MTQQDVTEVLLANGSREVRHVAGDIIFLEGSFGSEAYYVLEGQVDILQADRWNPRRLIGVIEAGDLFGEAAFLDQTHRLATAQAAVDCRLIAIPCEPLRALIGRHPRIASWILEIFSRRLRLAERRTHQAELAGEVSQRSLESLEGGLREVGQVLEKGAIPHLTAARERTVRAQSRAPAESTLRTEDLNAAANCVVDAQNSLEAAIRALEALGDDGPGMMGKIEDRLAELHRLAGIETRFDGPVLPEGLVESATARAIVQIVDAGASWAGSREGAGVIEITLTLQADALELNFADRAAVPGDGSPPEVRDGLEALRSRVLLARGTMSVLPREGGGTRLTIRVRL